MLAASGCRLALSALRLLAPRHPAAAPLVAAARWQHPQVHTGWPRSANDALDHAVVAGSCIETSQQYSTHKAHTRTHTQCMFETREHTYECQWEGLLSRGSCQLAIPMQPHSPLPAQCLAPVGVTAAGWRRPPSCQCAAWPRLSGTCGIVARHAPVVFGVREQLCHRAGCSKCSDCDCSVHACSARCL